MSLKSFQTTLLTLYTDSGSLAAFLKKGREALPSSLTEREKDALLSLPKEALETFAHELRVKRVSVSKELLERVNAVILFPVHRYGPTLFIKDEGAYRQEVITIGARTLFSQLVKDREKLSYGNLVHAARKIVQSGDDVGLGDVLRAMMVVRKYKLTGRPVRRTL